MGALLASLQKKINEQRQKNQAAELQKSAAAGSAFLAENAKRPGVKTTASGLQYKVLTPGTGKKPTPKDTVTVNYRGTLVDGTEFDSSYSRGQPATFPVEGVIAGWTEALQLMQEGVEVADRHSAQACVRRPGPARGPGAGVRRRAAEGRPARGWQVTTGFG